MAPRAIVGWLLAAAILFHVFMHVQAGCTGWDLLVCEVHR